MKLRGLLILFCFLPCGRFAIGQTAQMPPSSQFNTARMDEDALILKLRFELNENARLQAAQQLGGSANCTRYAIAALLASAMGTNDDGYPAEFSPTVRTQAARAIQSALCLAVARPPDAPASRQVGSYPIIIQTSHMGAPPNLAIAQRPLTAYYTEVVAKCSDDEMLNRACLLLAENLGASNQNQNVFQQGMKTPHSPANVGNSVFSLWGVSNSPLVNRRPPTAFTFRPTLFGQFP